VLLPLLQADPLFRLELDDVSLILAFVFIVVALVLADLVLVALVVVVVALVVLILSGACEIIIAGFPVASGASVRPLGGHRAGPYPSRPL